MRIIKAIVKILIVLWSIFCLVGVIGGISSFNLTAWLFVIPIVAIPYIILFLILKKINSKIEPEDSTSEKTFSTKHKISEDKTATSKSMEKSKKKEKNIKQKSYTMQHINGLPISENANCNVMSYDDKFTFTSGSMSFELEKSKITDICIKTDREIQQQYVANAGKAIAGAVVFGPLGAIIGGKPKKKTVKSEIHNYLIITYQSDGIKYIGFDICHNWGFANLCVKEFKNSTKSVSTYQL